MSRQEGNEKSTEYQDEEWQAGNPGRLPDMRHQDLPHWEELKLLFESIKYQRGWRFLQRHPASLMYLSDQSLPAFEVSCITSNGFSVKSSHHGHNHRARTI
jgi:hypothetical protein